MSSATSSEPRRGAAAALLTGAALSGFDAGAVGFVLPALRAATGADAGTASWLVSGYVVGTLLAIASSGIAVARFGALRLFRAGLVLAAVGALLALVADGMPGLIGARLLQGLGQGPLLPLAATLVAQRWPAERQGRLIGALSLVYGAAFLLATVATPPLLQFGWRASFALSLLGTLLAGLLAQRAGGWIDGKPASSTAHVPAGWRGLLIPQMAAIAVLSLGTGIGQAVLVLFPTLAIVRLGVPPLATAVLMLPLVAGGLAATLLITAVLDRMGARRLLAAGAIATLAGVLLAAVAPPSRVTYMAGAAALGLGITGLCGGPLRYAAARALAAGEQGLAQGAVALLTNLGLLGGSVLLGTVSAAQRSELIGVQTALLAACAVMAFCFAALFALPAHQRPAAS